MRDEYELEDGWKVVTSTVLLASGPVYRYAFYDGEGDCMLVLSEHDMKILSKIYSEHNTGDEHD